MNRNYIALASALLIATTGFAQKDQVKAAEKALKSGDPNGAITTLTQAEPLLANASDEDKANFYFTKGNAYFDLAKKNVNPWTNYLEASKAYSALEDIEKKSGKEKFSKLAQISQVSVAAGLKKNAFEDYEAKKYKDAATKFYAIYQQDKTDLDFLYDAGNSAYVAKDNDAALKYLNELLATSYTGEHTSYTAIDKSTKEKAYFDTAKERDDAIKTKQYDTPGEDKVTSRRGEIYKLIAGIDVDKNQIPEAKAAIAEARKAYPDDIDLAFTEATIYYKANDLDTYKKIINQILEKQPNNKDLIFNLGTLSYQNKDYAAAEGFYTKVIALDPNYKDAYFNMSAVKIDQAQLLLDQMNKLGTSPADNKKYEALKKERDALLVVIQGYLEKTVSLDDSNLDAKKALLSVYNAMDMTDKAKPLKEKIKAQEAAEGK